MLRGSLTNTIIYRQSVIPTARLARSSTIWALTETADFEDSQCLNLCLEFQFEYTVARWATDMEWAVKVVGINDRALMLRIKNRPMNWTLVESWLRRKLPPP